VSRRRQPESTKRRLLQAAFREIHRNGFRSSDVGSILDSAGVTKGALYHHYQSKTGLGYAVVDQVLRDWILDRWLRPITEADDPVQALIDLLAWAARHSNLESLALGCPLNNLAQEMSAKDSGFRSRLASIYLAWRSGIQNALEESRNRGQIRSDVDCAAAAALIVAAWEGSIGLSKTDLRLETVDACRRGLASYLEGLRP
jgi:AcrR family transcriptional regulator